MTSFYISPSSFNYKQYSGLIAVARGFGWNPTWAWPRNAFHLDAFVPDWLVLKALKAIGRSDIFIALVPGTSSTNIEIGTAFTLCEELFLVSRDPVHFTQTGLCDAYITVLPRARRICCEVEEIPFMLRQEYIHLIRTG